MGSSGVVVCIAAYNSARFMPRTLASIDAAMKDRPYALVIADDNSKDDTVKVARHFPMRARERIITTLPRSTGIGESKNRAVRLAKPLMHQFPWVAFMDDDDEMLPGRFDVLLERMEAEQQKAGVGDWIHNPQWYERPHTVTGDWSIHHWSYSPGMTLVHRDVIPKNGDYFSCVPWDVYEDMVTHRRLALSGVPWCYHGGAPIHLWHRRFNSTSGGPVRSAMMERLTREYIRNRFADTYTSIKSFCTVAYGPSVGEAVLMLKSLRLSGNLQPVLVLSNEAGARAIRATNVPDVETMVCDTAGLESSFTESPSYTGSALNLGAMLGKMTVIAEAARRHGSTLYLDADIVVLRPFLDVIEAPVGLSPELSRSSRNNVPSSWDNERFGYFNGGYFYATKDSIHLLDWWRQEYLNTWTQFGCDRRAHGCFAEQSALDLLPLFGDVHIFHPGHNVMYTRVPRDMPAPPTSREGMLDQLKLYIGHDMYFRGWPVMTLHAHFLIANRATTGSRTFRAALGMSDNTLHKSILALMDAETP